MTRFADAPAESLAHGGSDADVLIGPSLAGRDLAEALLPLDGRVEFFLTDMHRFLDIPAERRNLLAMRWLGSREGLRAGDDLTYVAIRARAPNARGAQAFLLWLFEPATQAALLELGRREQLTGFGIAGGLPALVEAARHDLATHYPALVGRVPSAAELHAPAALGADWARLREAVVLPWLWAETRGAEQPALADAVAAAAPGRGGAGGPGKP